MKRPSDVACQNAAVVGVTIGAGFGSDVMRPPDLEAK